MFKRPLSLLLCLLVAVPSLAFCAFAQENEVSPAEISYEITDPYAEVDWDSWGIYKAQLHTQSNARATAICRSTKSLSDTMTSTTISSRSQTTAR